MLSGKIGCTGMTLAALLTVLTVSNVLAQPQAGIDLAYKSKYIWRGIPLNNETVLWPDGWVGYRGFTATVFGSLEMTNCFGNQDRCTELDVTLDYSRSLSVVDLSGGFTYFTYPHTGAAETGEFYAKAGMDLKVVHVAVNGYFDVVDVKGIYLSPEINRTLDLKPVQPTVKLSLGYGNRKNNEYWFAVSKASLTDLTGSLGLSWTPPGAVGKWVTVIGDLDYSRLLNSDLAAAYPGSRDYVWFGLGLTFSTADKE